MGSGGKRSVLLSSVSPAPNPAAAAKAEKPAETGKRCANCEYALVPQAKFCANCGKAVADATPPSTPEEHWGPLRIRLFGRKLKPEATSLFALVSVLAAAVMVLSVVRFFNEGGAEAAKPTTQTAARTETVEPVPPATSIPQKRIPAHSVAMPHKLRDRMKTADAPQLTAVPVRPVINSFHLSKSRIERGESAELSWSVDGVNSVTIEPGIGTLESARGTQQVMPSQTTSYKLVATGKGGSVASVATLSVDPIASPSILSFEANPAVIGPGQHSRLQWNVAGKVSNVGVDPGFSNVQSQASLDVAPSVTTAYTLRVDGPGGTVYGHAAVQVTAPRAPAIVFDAQPAVISQGESAALHWRTPDNTRISIDPGGVFGNGQAITSLTVKPLTTTTYTLTAELPSGPEVEKATIVVNPHTGPSSGEIVWTGVVSNGAQIVRIDRDHADFGSLQGSLPGLPCSLQPTDEKRVSITSAPGPKNNFDRMQIRILGKGTTRAVIRWSIQ